MSLSEYAKFTVNLDRNPVNSKKRKNHWKFLTSKDHRGLSNPPRTHTEINEALRDSFLYIHHAMKYTKNLVVKKGKNKNLIPNLVGKKHLYEIFNAVNLESFFGSLLRDTKLNSRDTIQSYKYDFRTSENARLMLEIALNYLLNSPEFEDRESTIENTKQISEDFKLLSRSTLSKERELLEQQLNDKVKEKTAKQIDIQRKEFLKILDKLYDTIIPISSLTNLPDSIDVEDIGKALKETKDKIILELMEVKLTTKNKNALKTTNQNLTNELEKIKEGLILIKSLHEIENKMIKIEKELYNEIKNYFSPINPITDFTISEEIKKEIKRELSNIEFH